MTSTTTDPLGVVLSRARRAADLTQEQLGRMVQVTGRTIRDWEHTGPPRWRVHQLGEALGAPLASGDEDGRSEEALFPRSGEDPGRVHGSPRIVIDLRDVPDDIPAEALAAARAAAEATARRVLLELKRGA